MIPNETWTIIENAEAEAEQRNDWKNVAALCRKALDDAPGAPSSETEAVRFKLAYALLREPTQRERNLRDAIAVYEELLPGTAPGSGRFVDLHSGLAQAYSKLVAVSDEKPSQLLKSVAHHYERALEGSIGDPALRASIEAQAAYALMYIGEERRAKEYLERALVVFTHADFPEEFAEVSEALTKLAEGTTFGS
jgi:hypothetical protein